MRPISMERVEKTRENILGIITNKALTHEQKLTNLANAADGLLEVLDVPEGLDELLNRYVLPLPRVMALRCSWPPRKPQAPACRSSPQPVQMHRKQSSELRPSYHLT